MEALWSIATIGGPVILGAVLVFGVWRNRRKRGEVAAERRAAGTVRQTRSGSEPLTRVGPP
jgi:FtsZ-interacting cell division protein ZipA